MTVSLQPTTLRTSFFQGWMRNTHAWLRHNPVLLVRRCTEASLAVAVVLSVYSMISASHDAAKNPQSGIGFTAPASRPAPAYENVAGMHLFGASAPAPAAFSVQGLDAAITLDGIIAADDEKDSLAMISEGGDTKSYRVGQTLQDGETILHIEPAAIVLQRLGQTRRVEMDIKYADTNAVFHKANLTGDDRSDWSDAYLGPSTDNGTGSAANARPAGIAVVPAASYTPGSTMSLKAIREARAERFAQFKDAPLKRPRPPKPN